MSDLGNLNEFMKVARNDAWQKIKKNPARILYGAVDPASTWMWNKILGKHDQPILNQLGSPMGGGGLGLNKHGGVYADAKNQGVDVKAGRRFFGIGDTIAGIYGGNAAGSALGGATGTTSGVGSGASVGATENGAGLVAGTASDAASAGGLYSSAAGPTVASQFATPAASSFAGSAGSTAGAGVSNTQLINQGMGLLKQDQQQPQVQSQYPVQQVDPQQQQRRQIAMQQELQMQALRAKPNKTLDDLQQMKALQTQQGLLGSFQQ